jgi:hypothetical protein
MYAGGAYEPLVPYYNQIITDVALRLDVPLWNYWQSMQYLPNKGIGGDGVHPSVYPGGSGNFTDTGLLFGYNMRNLTALAVLDRIKNVVIDNGTPDAPTVSADIVSFVDRLYQTVLGHAPDAAGRSVWAHMIQDGLPRDVLVNALWYSPEHRGLQVDQVYQSLLHHGPDADGRAFWVNQLMSGMSVTALQQALLTSADYLQLHPGDAYAAALFSDVLGRPGDANGLASVQQALQFGVSPATIVGMFLSNPEAQTRAVDQMYRALLGQPLDANGAQFWVSMLQLGWTTFDTIGVTVLDSDSFFQMTP